MIPRLGFIICKVDTIVLNGDAKIAGAKCGAGIGIVIIAGVNFIEGY